MLGTCALIMCHLTGLVLLQSDFLAGILFLRKSLQAINLCVLCVSVVPSTPSQNCILEYILPTKPKRAKVLTIGVIGGKIPGLFPRKLGN